MVIVFIKVWNVAILNQQVNFIITLNSSQAHKICNISLSFITLKK
jgi:hypothetical protein